jgi:DNA topoisomerase-1
VNKALIVVESPTKVKTIKKYVGKQYAVAATVGHIKDLPERQLGIDIEDGFRPLYQTIAGKQKVISELKKAAGGAVDIYLAPDPDREGEAIAWHVAEILKAKDRSFHRVLFHELTQGAITEAMAHPLPLNRPKYEAQQARRILDRIVGYQVSPLLWRKVKAGLSAGRVQSVAVRIICEREKAIQAFEPEEYWSITAHLHALEPPPFTARLSRQNGKKIKIGDAQTAGGIVDALQHQAFVVHSVQKKRITRQPLPPFTTSKLQQESIRKLRFSARHCMSVAQQLYEGIELGPGEPVGLITYMRTDSTRIAGEAAQEAQALIRERYGDRFALDKPRFFKNRNKVQDAHEAIRPTAVTNTPEKVARFLNKDQMALYRLIWERFVASQMAPALIDQNLVAIKAGAFEFNASGSTVHFPGFMSVYLSADDEKDMDGKDRQEALPDLAEKMVLKLEKLDPKQHFTQPPPRFSEASLVKELEENGIGRPSTYAAILSTIRDKGYVEMVKGYFRPSELGILVNDLLVANFPDIFDVDFTARMEENLDRVETAETEAPTVLGSFYQRFQGELDAAMTRMLSMRGVGLATGIPCPRCANGELHLKVAKNGPYAACNKYPACRFTANYSRDEKGQIQLAPAPQEQASDKLCPLCGMPMMIKDGRYGPFLACSGYPKCKNTQSMDAAPAVQAATGVACPKPDCPGQIVEKKSKRGKTFYGCNRYPNCDFAKWDKPINQPCPKCGATFLVEKTSKREGTVRVCPNPGCNYRQKVESPAEGAKAQDSP